MADKHFNKGKKLRRSRQDDRLQLVTFNVADELFAADILSIKEIVFYQAITRIPDSPDFIEGFIVIRDEVVPIIDLRKRFYTKEVEIDADTQVIVVSVGNNMMGFVVDIVLRVIKVEKDSLTKAPKLMTRVDVDYLKGVIVFNEQKILVLDFNKILSKSKKVELLNLLNEEDKLELAKMITQT